MDASFEQEVTLADGRRVHLRWIRRTDEALLREGYARLSPASRYARFHTTRKELPSELLRRLTDVDGVEHCALVAVETHAGVERGLGVARFVRIKEDPASAEVAVTIADEVQGLGLAARMLGPLASAARERGIEAFVGYVLSENMKARRLLRTLGAEWLRTEQGLATYRLPIGRRLEAAVIAA